MGSIAYRVLSIAIIRREERDKRLEEILTQYAIRNTEL